MQGMVQGERLRAVQGMVDEHGEAAWVGPAERTAKAGNAGKAQVGGHRWAGGGLSGRAAQRRAQSSGRRRRMVASERGPRCFGQRVQSSERPR
nr:hypothetical protein GCM10010200_043400 [Actinomadura rugatobispora]